MDDVGLLPGHVLCKRVPVGQSPSLPFPHSAKADVSLLPVITAEAREGVGGFAFARNTPEGEGKGKGI